MRVVEQTNERPSTHHLFGVQPVPNPIGPVIPVDTIAIRAQHSTDPRPRPVRRYAVSPIERPRSPLPRLILQRQIPAMLLNRARQRTIPIRIPVPIQIRAAPPTPAAVPAPSPERPIRPVDLASISTQRARDELPSRRDNLVRSLKITDRRIPVLIGQVQKNPIVADRSLFHGIPLSAPSPKKSRALRPIRLRPICLRVICL
jgi:hypothetical protein